jgi:hypothetical protein
VSKIFEVILFISVIHFIDSNFEFSFEDVSIEVYMVVKIRVLTDVDSSVGSTCVVLNNLRSTYRSWVVLIQVTGPDGRNVHNTNTIDGEQFEFVAHQRGRYKFCFHNPLSAPEQVTFYIHVGHVPGIEDLAKDGKIHISLSSMVSMLPDLFWHGDISSSCIC